MKKWTFAVDEVVTHNQREMGNHAPTKDVVAVTANDENTARSMARAELAKRSPGVQKYQPGALVKVEDGDSHDAGPFFFSTLKVVSAPFVPEPAKHSLVPHEELGKHPEPKPDGRLHLRLNFQPQSPAQHDLLVKMLPHAAVEITNLSADQGKPISLDIAIGSKGSHKTEPEAKQKPAHESPEPTHVGAAKGFGPPPAKV
jgi:hypothetical protein